MAYNPADFELVEAPAGSAPPYNPADFELVDAPQGSGFWRQSLDLPVSALGGVVTGLKGMSDVFGANNPVSRELASYQQFYNDALSPEAQADQQEVARIMQEAQDKGVWEQIKAGGRAFAVAPLDTTAQSLGTMAPIVATGLAGRAVGLGAKGVQIAQAAAGAGMQMGSVKDDIYQNTKQFLMQQGKSEEDADKVALEAQSYRGQNLDQILIGAGLGAADALLGVEKILGNTISKTGEKATGGIILKALKAGVEEAVPEGAQGGQESLAQNLALQRQGYDVPTMRGVVAQGTMEGIAGFVAGAPVGAADGMAPRVEQPNGAPISVPANQPAPDAPEFVPPPAAETVVVEEVFGDPTTAAAETEAAQHAPAYNPDDFEVVEEPSAPIVTEPPAAEGQVDSEHPASIAGFGVPQVITAMAGAVQESASDLRSRVSNVKYGPIENDESTITFDLDGQPQKAVLRGANADFVIGTSPEADASIAVRTILSRDASPAGKQQPSGPQSGIDVSQETDGGSTPPGSIDAENLSSPAMSGKRSEPATAGSAINLSNDDATILASIVAGKIKLNSVSKEYREDIAKYIPLLPKDFAEFIVSLPGRSSVRGPRVISFLESQQASTMPVQEEAPKRKPTSLEARAKRDGYELVYHGDRNQPGNPEYQKWASPNLPLFTAYDKESAEWFGEARPLFVKANRIATQQDLIQAAQEQGVQGSYTDPAEPVSIPEVSQNSTYEGTNINDLVYIPRVRKALADKGFDAVRTWDQLERDEVDTLIVIGSPDQVVDPADTPSKRSRRRIKNMTAQSGAIDLSIVEDLVEYGKTVYRAGMDYATWAAAMVKEFGQAVADYLRQAFDRIVQEYKDSPYSDTTGAVGDVRPKAKPRQFEQKAKQSDAITEEAKAELGSEYVPITLEGTADQAKAWINENGLDASEQRILDLSTDELTPTPVDFAIGLEMAARLGALGEHQRQARVVRIMSRRATSIGQTISVLAMLSRLTPEGIVFYANQIIEQHIDSLPEERQKQIRAAQESVVSAETEVKQTRKNLAEDTIINGTQGGEKIQEKLKRRIKDKTQKQRTNVGIRSVLTSKATKAEAINQIAQLLTESGISESEAGALAAAITSRFYKVMDEARKAIATQRKPKEPKLIKIWSKLIARLNGDGISDDDFVAGLSLMAKLPTMTPELGAKLKDLTRQLKKAKGDQDMQLVIAGRIFEEIHGLVPVDFWVKVRAFSYLMMLFSPKTWIRNIGGNMIQWVANAGADTAINVAGGRGSIFSSGKTGDRVKSGRLKSLLTPIWDVQKGFEWNAKQNPQATFGQNLAAGIDHLRLLSKLTTQNKFEVADAKEVGRRIFSSKFMGMLDTSLSIALGAADRAFWKSALEASLANREARARQMGEWTGRHTPEDIAGAFADAAAAIYQNANTISKTAAKWRSSLNFGSTKLLSYFLPGVKPTEQFGFGTALMAFTQVPGAIARTAINWSPLGLITNLSQAMNGVLWKASNQRAGKPFDQQEFAKAFTRALGGTGIYVAGYYLYAMGVITASQEDDDDLEAMRRASGLGQYRINVTALNRLLGSMAWSTPQKAEDGDLILSYDWAQPLAITFAAGAELAKMVEQNDRNGIKKGLAAKAAMPAISLAAGAKSLLELPLLSGLSSFIDQIDTKRPETIVGAISRTVMGIPSMFVPQLVRQANQLMDNSARETRGSNTSSPIPVTVQRAFNQIAANTPGVADKFPPRIDIMGQAQERYQYGSNHWFNVLINPALTSRVKVNPALQEVERLMQTTGDTKQLPRAVSRTADINGQKIDLTNEQISAYQYYLGNYTMSMFNWRMASPVYARLPDTEKVRLLAQDLEDVNAATKSALFGHDIRRLTRRQRVMRNNLVNSPLGRSMPPR